MAALGDKVRLCSTSQLTLHAAAYASSIIPARGYLHASSHEHILLLSAAICTCCYAVVECVLSLQFLQVCSLWCKDNQLLQIGMPAFAW
jgi:hypothetical protein